MREHLWRTFSPGPEPESAPVVVGGTGPWLHTEDGRRLFNGFSGLALICGLGDERIEAAITAQLSQLPSCSTYRMRHRAAEGLADDLVQLLPSLGRVHLVGSGAEAVEGAIKIARQYWAAQGHPERRRIVSFARAYHGCSLGTMGLGGLYDERTKDLYGVDSGLVRLIAAPPHRGVPAAREGFASTDQAALQALEEVLLGREGATIAAVLVEPVLAAGGVHALSPTYSAGLADLARRSNTLLIVDESATGLGRTGEMFAHQRLDLEPDMVVLAKGLSGGYLPLGAVMAAERVTSVWDEHRLVLAHGASASANPLSAAAGRAALDNVVSYDYPGYAAAASRHLAGVAAAISLRPDVHEVRTCGLMMGVEWADAPSAEHGYTHLLAHGLATHVGGQQMSIFPPIKLGHDDVTELAGVLQSLASASPTTIRGNTHATHP